MKTEIEIHRIEEINNTVIVDFAQWDEVSETTVEFHINRKTLVDFVTEQQLNRFEFEPGDFTYLHAGQYTDENLSFVVSEYIKSGLEVAA